MTASVPVTPDVSKAPERIAGMFDAIAARYDLLNHLLSAGIDRRWRRTAIRSLGLKGGECVLDLCTGTADLAIEALSAQPAVRRVIGVDFASAMLGVGQMKLRQRSLEAVTLVRGDATCVPLAPGSVDAVTVAFGIRNVADTSAACAEMHRVLTPGGRLAILEFAVPTAPLIRGAYLWYFNRVLPRIGRALSRHNAAYQYLPASVSAFSAPAALAGLLQQTGFRDVTFRPLSFGIVMLYTALRP
jgi:demethylmenaquinone methyltransferase/2-methoxy-6-polyprenyl-1,4-benzoquinol methylase